MLYMLCPARVTASSVPLELLPATQDTLARVLAILCRNTDRYASSLDGLLDLDYFNLFAVEDAGCKTSVRICSLEHVLKIQIPHKSVS